MRQVGRPGSTERNVNIMKKKNVTSLSEFIDNKAGKRGTKKREKFEAEYDAFKLGVLIQQARQEKGLTQEIRLFKGLEREIIDAKLTSLLKAFSTDDLDQETINKEVEIVRTELYASSIAK